MTLWLLDTNIASDFIRNPFGAIAQRLATLEDEQVCTSIIVACELRYGARKRQSRRLDERIEAFLAVVEAQPFSQDADHHYARLRCDLERRGTPIGQHDMLIAAHALALDATLVTADLREFSRIEGLRLENWLS